MNILMVTNTFAPNVSGVARSVTMFTEAYRSRGHRVMVVAPEFDGAPENEVDVVRIGALRNFAGTDYSVVHRLRRSISPVPSMPSAPISSTRMGPSCSAPRPRAWRARGACRWSSPITPSTSTTPTTCPAIPVW